MGSLLSKLFTPISGILNLVKASAFLLKLIGNYGVLKEAGEAVSSVFKKLHAENRNVPTQEECLLLLQAASNILKTGVVDIPGFDEFELSADLDKYASSVMIGIEDKKSGKFHELALSKKEK